MIAPVLAGLLVHAMTRLPRAAIPGAGVLAAVTGVVAAAGVAAAQQAVHSPHGALPDSLECSACHTAEGWRSLRTEPAFRHGASTGFVLTGAHKSAACASCHTDLRFDGPKVRPDDCASCHTDIHEGRMLPECSACHTTGSFTDVDGERIHARTSFPLTGAHLQITCESCHVTARGGAFTRLDPDCMSCHAKDYTGARTVDHVTAGYPTNCTVCHGTLSWSDTQTFDHATISNGFVLKGAHTRLECASCHRPSDMAPLFQAASQDDCVACHQADFDREHAGTSFPTTCLSCHNMETWGDVGDFDHALTGFQLQGSHASLGCASCHAPDGRTLLFPRPTSQTDCIACHKSDYDHQHGGSGFPTTCLSCHSQSSWDNAGLDHVAVSGGFALAGPHATAACTTCHQVPGYQLLFPKPTDQSDCVACHRSEYDAQHAGSGFPTTCLSCHQADVWTGATLDHVSLSGGFALTGPHATAACATCHQIPGYQLLFPKPSDPNDCVACHQSDYDAHHAGSGFPTTCLSCHQADAWTGANVDHVALSGGFALTGPHATASCATCHQVPGYQLLFPKPTGQNDCVACHQADYDAQHAGSGFPTTCLSCHQANTWTGASVDHVSISGGFALQGAHGTLSCTACHAVPGYTLLFPKPAGQNDCVTCHQSQFDAAHGGIGFPSTCLTCHTVNAWLPSSFDHDAQYFPIYSGTHQGRWSTCAACHTVSGNFGAFTCLVCHEHSKSNTDSHHQGVSGYVYDSNACYSCHRGGGGG